MNKDNPNVLEAASIVTKVMKAIKEFATDGMTQILVFGDAEVIIRKKKTEEKEAKPV